MKKIFISILVTIALSFSYQKKSKIVFFGDSITEAGVQRGGYIVRIDSMCLLEKKSERYEFTGAGVSGNKVYDLFLRLEKDVLDKSPDLVVIYIGVNDVWHKASSGTGTDADKFEKFYQAIIDKLISRSIKMILCTPAAIGERTDFSNQQDGDLNHYANIIRKLASKNQLALVDLRKTFLDYNLKYNKENKDRGILTGDRVHLNATGNQLVADEIWRAIKKI